MSSTFSSFSLIVLATAVSAFGQTANPGVRNNPYAPSPASGGRAPIVSTTKVNAALIPGPTVADVSRGKPLAEPPKAVITPARPAASISPAATNVYLIDSGDVLKIDLKNSPQGTGYYRVDADGMIDYPLAGGRMVVRGRDTAQIANGLAAGIKLFRDPQISVKVSEFRSHVVIVSGLAYNPGQKNLRREAMPLYVIKAEVEVRREATHVIIRRSGNSVAETHDLRSSATDSVLIFPGDSIEFRREGA